MKMLVAITAVLAVASSSMASMWMHEDFESYNSDEEMWQVWKPIYGAPLNMEFTRGWEGPQGVGGAKGGHRRHTRDLVPDIQAAPGGAGRTSVKGTDTNPLVMEAAYWLDPNMGMAQSQAFYLDVAKGGAAPPTSPRTNPRSLLAFGAFAGYEGEYSRVGLMYYDGLNWTELTSLRHAPLWNFIRAIIKETTVSIMYFDENMSNGMQIITVPRVYLGDFDKMGMNSATTPARVKCADAFHLSSGEFIPEPATVLLLALGGLVSMRSGLRRRRVTTDPACGG